jgi:hypothetical protein
VLQPGAAERFAITHLLAKLGAQAREKKKRLHEFPPDSWTGLSKELIILTGCRVTS